MADFHRLSAPVYFGGLPSGYDYLNDPADPSVGGSGVPAVVDGIKSGGTNDGTYFVAFAEDGLSKAVNRGLGALGLNTDYLDDVLRDSVPKILTADATAVGAVSTIALTGEIFVGEFGMANNATNRNLLVHITEQSTNDDLEVSGSKIVPTLIHDGASANVVGTEATGFRTNASVNVSPPIPNGTQYRVWYGIRSSLNEIAQTEKGAYFKYIIRTAEHIPAVARSLFRQLHSEASVNQAYTAAWDSTIRSLASSGLNERYRRSTTQPAGFVTGDYNVAGGGAVILRDGPAVELKATTGYLFSGLTWPDGNKATLKLGLFDSRSGTSNFISDNDGGDFGVWHESEWKPDNNISDAGMFHRSRTAGPALVDSVPYDMRLSTFNSDTLQTFINAAAATATLNPDSINTTSARRTVECGAGQYFSLTAPVRTAIRVGIDLLEVTDSSSRVRTFIIETIVSATRVRVIGYGGFGSTNLFAAAAEAGCKIRILQMTASIGGPLSFANNGLLKRPLFVMPPAILTTAVANENIPGCAFFGAQTGSVTDALADARRSRALEWGSTASPDSGGTVDGTITPRGWLKGDGSLTATSLLLTTGGLTLSAGSITLTLGSITAGGDIIATDDLQAGDDLFVGGDANVTGGATIGTFITATAGDITATAGNIVATTGNVTAGADIVATDDLQAGDDLFVTNDIEWGGQLRLSSSGIDSQSLGGGNHTLVLGAGITVIRLSLSGTPHIVGIDATGITKTRFVWLINVDGTDVVDILGNNAAATNLIDRFATALSDYVINPGRGTLVMYDLTLTRWVICSN